MKNRLRSVLIKNKRIFYFLKKMRILASIVQVYFLKFFNSFRIDCCSKDTIRCEYNIKNKNYKYTLLGGDTPTCCLTHLYEITRDITGILNSENIDYFIMYGTLLGQVRHNETFIPWDTDVDIVVMKKDKIKVENLLSAKLSSIYHIIKAEQILKINFSKTNQLHADIYFWEEADGILIDTLNDYWIKSRVKKEDVFPVAISKLYDLDINVPKNSVQVLKDTYGSDCLDHAFKKYAFQQKNMGTFNEGKIDENYEEKIL